MWLIFGLFARAARSVCVEMNPKHEAAEELPAIRIGSKEMVPRTFSTPAWLIAPNPEQVLLSAQIAFPIFAGMPDADDIEVIGLDSIDNKMRGDGMNPHQRA